MREILFRGKRTDNGEWVFGDLEHNGKNVPKWVNGNKIAPETIGQFTCLTDKNGKKIFEGDIIKSLNEPANSNAPIGSYGVVKYDDEFYEYIVDYGVFLWYECLGHYCSKDCEVIGNIYDTPELLEK